MEVFWKYFYVKRWAVVVASVGRAVASDTRDPQFESTHREILYVRSLRCIETTKIDKKRPGMAQFFKKTKWNLIVTKEPYNE